MTETSAPAAPPRLAGDRRAQAAPRRGAASPVGRPPPASSDPAHAPPPERPWPFLLGLVRRRPVQFSALLLLIAGAAACAVGVQYGMKLIVDAMALGDRNSPAIWRWLALFIALIASESLLWRLGGWLGCRTVVGTCVDVRLDLFRHLTGHPMRYFSEHLSDTDVKALTHALEKISAHARPLRPGRIRG